MKRSHEEDFPRGGGGGGGGGGGAGDEAPRRAKKRVLALPRLDTEDDGGPSVSGKLPTFVEQLKYKGLSVGTKLWGSVLEASATRLVVALPSGLRGTVRASEASDAHAEHLRNAARAAAASGSDEEDEEAAAAAAAEAADDPSAPPPLHAQFSVGQLLRVVVTSLGAGAGDSGAAKRVELSARLSRVVGALPLPQLRPGRALPATVRSVEDHGYVLCLGPAKASGFLPRALAPKTKQPLRPGAHLEAVVTAVDATRRVVAVTAAPAAVASAALADADDVALAALLPGALVSARVRAVLPDGLQLSFLTYFTGTVDWFHLDTPFPTPGALGSAYAEGAKLKARVLFVDAATKRVGLTLRRRLLDLAPPAPLPPIGTRLPSCIVRRVDPDVGLLCAMPAVDDAAPQAGYVHISAVADSRVEKLEKRFKRGQEVEARVVGYRPLEDCAVLSLKPSVLRAAFFGYADVAPGSLVDCVVESVDASGAALSLGAGLRARAATQHLSDTGAARAAAKLRPGAAVRGRVLAVDAAARRVSVTLKPSLVNSKLPALATPADAPAGTTAHGFVTGVQPYGVFVAFYGQLRGLAHVSHLGLEGGQTPADAFAPGQVVKATVLGATTHAQRGVVLDLALGAASKKALNASAEADEAAGSAVSYEPLQEVPSATVLRVVASGRRGVEVALTGGGSAFLEEAQLADSAAAASALLDALAPLPPGTELGPLLVLARAPGGRLALSRKPALRSAAASGALPRTFADCQPGQLLTGFVAGVTAAGVFVRFAERLTGLAPPSQLADAFVASPAAAFALGQTVAAKVYTVDAAAGRLALSLKPSACRGEGASALRSALAAGAELDALHAAASGESAAWADAYTPGRVLDATVAEVKPYGTVLDIEGDEAAVGFVLPAQASGAPGGAPAAGASVRGVVLDVNRREGVVDVGLRAELLPAKGSSKAKAPKRGAALTAVVELVKPDYLVCSLPKHGAAVAYLQLGSFNARPDAAADAAYTVGQSLSAMVAETPSDATGGRMLLLPAPAADEAAGGEAPARGRAQQATVVAVRPTEAHLRLDNGRYGRLHATSMPPPPTPTAAPRGKRGTAAAAAAASPLAALAPGAALRVFVTGHARGDPAPDGKSFLELALPGADGAAPRDEDAPYRIEALAPGDSVTGVVDSVAPDGAWIALTPQLRGRLACLDGSADADEAKSFCARLQPGQSLRCAVLQVDAPRRHLDLTTRAADAAAKPEAPPRVGDVLPGRVTRAVPGVGLYVQLPAHKAGRVALTDLSDVYSESPLDGFEPGAVVAAAVVATGAGGRVDLSLRASRGGSGPKEDASAEKHQAELSAAADVSPGALVWGFVRHVSPKGCFVSLGRGLDARVLLSNLSDTFVPAPAAAFPAGALVRGRVLAVDAASGRVELSLKASEASGAPLLALADLTAGQTVRGTVKRCEAYGAFIAVDGSALVGMCHISEAADARVKDLAKLLRPGQRVRARVLAADTDTGRLSLGLKPSYFDGQAADEEATGAPAQGVDALAAYPDDDDDDDGSDSDAEEDEDGAGAGSDDEMEEADDADVMDADEEDDDESESEEAPPAAPPAKKGRAKAPSGDEVAQRMRDAPAAWAAPGGDDDELAFQWTDGRADAGGAAADDDDAAEAGAPSAAAAKKARKRAREAAEAAIRERERALATGDAAPASAADFERALLGSPNSSFLWIRYMAHLVSLGEVASARAVAERALGDGGVGYREQGEQLNVWVAWLNLENAYGAPTPEAAVSALFARAVQRNDAKKLHLARVGLHERAGQPEQAQKAAAALTRRFPASCKAWLRAHAAHLGAGAADAGRGALDAAVAALPRRKHAKLLVGAALAEFRAGDAERGRALLEGVLAAHPKRLDVWGVYLDAEAKAGDAQRTRALFERAVHLDLPPRKAKSLFKRYLAHEAAHGDKDGVARVKQLAADYVAQRGV